MARMPREDWLRIGEGLADGLAPLLPRGTQINVTERALWIISPAGGSLISRGFGCMPLLPYRFQIRGHTETAITQVIEWIGEELGQEWPWFDAAVSVRTRPEADGLTVVANVAGKGQGLSIRFLV